MRVFWYDAADGEKKGHFRRRSGDGTDLGASLYSYPAGTHPNSLAKYKVRLEEWKRLQQFGVIDISGPFGLLYSLKMYRLVIQTHCKNSID